MRKFWIVLVSIGLIMALAMPAFAVSGPDIKVTGSYYVAGVYEDNRAMTKNTNNTATAFFAQRLRMQPEFKIAEGLTLVTRFDAIEKKWGDQGWAANAQYDTTNRVSTGNSGSKVQENIEFERVYVDFNTGIGRFMVGYQDFVAWGTDFLDSHVTRPGIKWIYSAGPATIVAALEQVSEGSTTGSASTNVNYNNDSDKTIYDLGVSFAGKGYDTGVLFQYSRDASSRNSTINSQLNELYVLDPYVKATLGKFYVEAEGAWMTGKYKKYESASNVLPDVSVNGVGLYLGAKGDFGPAYVGAKFVYMSGDDPSTTDKIEGGMAAAMIAGQTFSPMLIMWNDQLVGWTGRAYGYASYPGQWNNGTAIVSYTNVGQSQFMDNCYFYNLYAGFKPIPKLDIMAAFAYATADQKPQDVAGPNGKKFVSDTYGTEFDITATYKIYDNLSYTAGFGYFFVGDYFKGTNSGNQIDNDYQFVHKLTLSF